MGALDQVNRGYLHLMGADPTPIGECIWMIVPRFTELLHQYTSPNETIVKISGDRKQPNLAMIGVKPSQCVPGYLIANNII